MDDFMDLWRFGVPQLAAWMPTKREHFWRHKHPKPEEPRRPDYYDGSKRRPARALPPGPSEWRIFRDMAPPDELDLYEEIPFRQLINDYNIREGYGHGDPDDCLTGRALVMECLGNAVEADDPPDWWDPREHDLAVVLDLMSTLHAADTAYRIAYREHGVECRRIEALPDADPEWRAYDEAAAAYPRLIAKWEADMVKAAQDFTGFATHKEAEDDYLNALRRSPGRSSLPGYLRKREAA